MISTQAATLKKVEPRVGTRNAQREKRWFSTSASSAGSSTRASTCAETASIDIEGTFPVSDATYCEGLRICNGAPDEAGQKAVYGANSKYGQRVATAKSCCYGGLRHSIKLYSPRLPTDWGCRGQTDPAIQAAVKANRPIKIV